jgi:hypothetical protein
MGTISWELRMMTVPSHPDVVSISSHVIRLIKYHQVFLSGSYLPSFTFHIMQDIPGYSLNELSQSHAHLDRDIVRAFTITLLQFRRHLATVPDDASTAKDLDDWVQIAQENQVSGYVVAFGCWLMRPAGLVEGSRSPGRYFHT